MSLQCANCRSLFFKTLETRILEESAALLYKKRCKRCKFKYLFKKDLSCGTVSEISLSEWQEGLTVHLAGRRIADRARIFVSEYTGRISHAAEDQLAYLQKIRQAEGVCHERQKNTG
jgi:hypothetical protein